MRPGRVERRAAVLALTRRARGAASAAGGVSGFATRRACWSPAARLAVHGRASGCPRIPLHRRPAGDQHLGHAARRGPRPTARTAPRRPLHFATAAPTRRTVAVVELRSARQLAARRRVARGTRSSFEVASWSSLAPTLGARGSCSPASAATSFSEHPCRPRRTPIPYGYVARTQPALGLPDVYA